METEEWQNAFATCFNMASPGSNPSVVCLFVFVVILSLLYCLWQNTSKTGSITQLASAASKVVKRDRQQNNTLLPSQNPLRNIVLASVLLQ